MKRDKNDIPKVPDLVINKILDYSKNTNPNYNTNIDVKWNSNSDLVKCLEDTHKNNK